MNNIWPNKISNTKEFLIEKLMNQQITIPVSTIDVSFDGIQDEDGSKLNHIHQIPFFQKFTIDEIRYYDYLKEEYISPVQPDKHHSFNQQNLGFDESNEPTIVLHEISPWSINFPSIPEI